MLIRPDAGGRETSRASEASETGHDHPVRHKRSLLPEQFSSLEDHRCRDCGNEENAAGANAGRNVRDRGAATIRARIDASR